MRAYHWNSELFGPYVGCRHPQPGDQSDHRGTAWHYRRIRIGRRLGRIGCDIACFPGYYLARLPRLPSIIGKYGLKGSVFRAAEVAEVETIAKRGYRLDRVLKTGAILSVRDRVRRVRPSPPA